MVKNAIDRIKRYNTGIDPLSIFLKVKKQNQRVGKPIFIKTEKDNALEIILNEYELDARQKTLAQQAFMELFYKGYHSQQTTTDGD